MLGESSNWRSYGSFVQEVILHQAEGPALDKKREHYYLYKGMKDDSGHPVDPSKKRAEFLKDIIALANTARWQNDRAYLCLGIEEHDAWRIWGVEGKHPRRLPSPSWADIEAHPDWMNKWVESIQREYTNLARVYVKPTLPDIHYETGWIKDHLIGLLIVRPVSSPDGFHLTDDKRKETGLRALGLEPGCSWRRLGALTEKIERDQRWMLKSYHEYPYIPLEGWRLYLTRLSRQYEYRPEHPNQADLYLPLQAQFGPERLPNAAEFLDRFAHDRKPGRVLLIVSPPGCGKTTLLERLTRDLAVEAHQVMEATHSGPYVPEQPRAWDYPKGVPVPVLIRLDGFEFSNTDTPENRFCQAMTHWGGETLKLDQHKLPTNILKDRDLDFVVMLDGLDEISRHPQSRWRRSLKALARFVEGHPHARFIITCRSDQFQKVGKEWTDYPQLWVEPMLPAQVRQYLGGTTWATLLDRPDILTSTLELLCNPRWISSLCKKETTTLNLGTVLENAIEGFLTEERSKHGSLDEERFRLDTQVDRFAFSLLLQVRV